MKITARRLWVTGSIAAVSLLAVLQLSGAPEELDPLKVAPDTHKLMFENRFVRVIQAKVPPGGHEPKHSHRHGVTIYLSDYDVEQKAFPDGKVTKHHRAFGTAAWSESLVHEIRNVGGTPLHSIRIELR